MSNTTVQARISTELKQDAEAVFSAIGLSVAEAIRLFLQQSVNSGGLPFQPTAKMPSPETKGIYTSTLQRYNSLHLNRHMTRR